MAPSFPPLAERLDLGSSGYSPWLVEGAVRVGMDRPFAPASSLLAYFTGVTMSPATVRRMTMTAGATMRQLELDGIAALPVGGGEPTQTPLQLSLDGSMVPLVGGWHEVKLLAIGERQADGPLTALSYAATLGDATAFGDEATGELVRRGVPGATDLVTVNDGAEWIQGVLELHCPTAVRILDFAHAASYLATAATEAYGEGTDVQRAWFTAQRHALRHGDPDDVLTALDALPASAARDTARGYLTARRDQIAYRDFIAQGWPIGSGCVESAHKGIVQQRLKGRGMRWTRPVADGMLALRVAAANDRWDTTWEQVGPHQRAARRATVATRRATRQRRPSRAKLVQHGKPTPDHPWYRFRLPGSPRFDHRM